MNIYRSPLRIKMAVVMTVLALWVGCGGQTWADSCLAAEQDKGAQLKRLVDDPRLPLTPSERQQLREAADRFSSSRRSAPVLPSQKHAERQAAVDLGAMASELDTLTASFRSADSAGQAQPIEARRAQIDDLHGRLAQVEQRIVAGFNQTESLLRQAQLPASIFERHAATKAQVLDQFAAALAGLKRAGASANPDEALTELAKVAESLRASTDSRPESALDPQKLPFRVAEATLREPLIAPDAESIINKSGILDARTAPPVASDLAANEDAQITPDIASLAASLGGSPVAIYNWVRNNIEFLPTYGSVQGSQMTLESRRGNAFDTASLLVALLRSAGIPARYATGTIEVPVDAVKNWVGGTATSQVAQQLLGQGGIPNVGLLSGGSITQIRLEHVWVEAFVDFVPGRGVKAQPGDSWVPLDASFKQYEYGPVSSFFADNPIEPVLDPGDRLFDVDETQGKITNVSDDILDDRLAAWAEQSELYLASNGIERTFDGLTGKKTLLADSAEVLPSSLPYRVLHRVGSVATLPASLRHAVTIRGFNSQFDRSFGNPAFTAEISMPALNSHRLGLQFDPATLDDAAVLATARNSGSSSLPVYLVRMIPSLKLDGVAIASGTPVGMGKNFFFDVVLRGPDGPTTVPYQAVVGDEIVIGITGNGVKKEVVEKRFAGNPVDNSPEYLHQVQLHYWTECDAMSAIAAKSLGVHMLRLPSVGVFASPLTVSYIFGAPRSGVYQSRIMDVKQSLVGAAGADPAKVTAAVKQSGFSGSYLEGAVFDQLENDPGRPISGISAVHLIAKAMRQGTPIYRITPANSAAALPQLNLSPAVERDISNAIAQGKTVLAPESELTLGPWSGVGYIIQDETTGAGAYLISGGLAGGGLFDCPEDLLPKLVLLLVIIIAIILLILLLWWLAGILGPILAGAGATAGQAFAYFLLMLRGLAPLAAL